MTIQSLTPVIVQNTLDNKVLMLAYMNQEALDKTIKTGYVHFWSRSRNTLWLKGETSGNKLKLDKLYIDCDQDTLLAEVTLEGSAVCHTGSYSCFFTKAI